MQVTDGAKVVNLAVVPLMLWYAVIGSLISAMVAGWAWVAVVAGQVQFAVRVLRGMVADQAMFRASTPSF